MTLAVNIDSFRRDYIPSPLLGNAEGTPHSLTTQSSTWIKSHVPYLHLLLHNYFSTASSNTLQERDKQLTKSNMIPNDSHIVWQPLGKIIWWRTKWKILFVDTLPLVYEKPETESPIFFWLRQITPHIEMQNVWFLKYVLLWNTFKRGPFFRLLSELETLQYEERPHSTFQNSIRDKSTRWLLLSLLWSALPSTTATQKYLRVFGESLPNLYSL